MASAYVTLLTVPGYLPGLLVLHQGLLSVGSKYPLVVMVTPSLPDQARAAIRSRGMIIRDIDHLYPSEGTHRLAEADARFRDTWTKLRAFELVEYERVVLLDADMVVRRNMDELMDLPLPADWIAAAHVCACNPRKLPHYPADWVPENCAHTAVEHPTHDPPAITDLSPRPYTQLNSGTVVLHPSLDVFRDIVHIITTSPRIVEYSFPDQDLLSDYFRGRWKPLSWRYNALKTLRNIHPQLWQDDEASCVHYIFADKPWKKPRGSGGEYEEVNTWWWDVYDRIRVQGRELDPEVWKLVDAHVTT